MNRRGGRSCASSRRTARASSARCTRSGNFGAAEEILGKSVDLSRSLGDPYREAQALLELGTVASRLPVVKDGPAMIEEAARLFDELGARYDVKRANAALGANAARAVRRQSRRTAALRV